MPRINPVQVETVGADSAEVLRTVKRKMGKAPNIVATMAHSAAAARAYLGFSQELAEGTLPPRLREQIALTVGQANGCDYCLAAHTTLGKGAGLSEAETCDARCATSHDAKDRAALQLARRIIDERGRVADADVEQARRAGYTDGEIVEIVAHVALNTFTNYFNHVADTELDFPPAPQLAAA